MTTATPATQTPATQTTTVDDGWKETVYMPDAFSSECVSFLNKHWRKGKLSKSGLLTLTSPIDEAVPYELAPSYVRKHLANIDENGTLPRSTYKHKRGYDCAQAALYVYGYRSSIDAAIIAKQKAKLAYQKRWRTANPDRVREINRRAKRYRNNHRQMRQRAKQLQESIASV